jgi:uncharacterized glyoxalase superfamily protein PhnB
VISNRSVPTDILLPHIVYQDVGKAIVWLTNAFGFREHYRYGQPGALNGAQMYLGNAWIMLHRAGHGCASPAQLGYRTQSLTAFVEDVDTHFEKAKSAGAKIVEELSETVYGERQYGAEDLDGHHWLFSRHARNLHPEEWGATVSQPAAMPTQISPMLAVSDARAAMEFYRAAFGAEVQWDLDGAIAGLSVGGARLFLAEESPPHGTRGPASVGFTTVRIELFVDDPVAVHKRAVAAGAIERSPVREHQHTTRGPQPIKRMLQGAVVDPFGHIWLVGKVLEQ